MRRSAASESENQISGRQGIGHEPKDDSPRRTRRSRRQKVKAFPVFSFVNFVSLVVSCSDINAGEMFRDQNRIRALALVLRLSQYVRVSRSGVLTLEIQNSKQIRNPNHVGGSLPLHNDASQRAAGDFTNLCHHGHALVRQGARQRYGTRCRDSEQQSA
jgi:hypothetical protein